MLLLSKQGSKQAGRVGAKAEMIELISSLSDRTRRWSTTKQRKLCSVTVGVWHLPICLTGQVQGLNNRTEQHSSKRQSNHQKPGCHLWFYILAFGETFHHHNKLDNSFIPRQKLCRSAVQNKQRNYCELTITVTQHTQRKAQASKENQVDNQKSICFSSLLSLPQMLTDTNAHKCKCTKLLIIIVISNTRQRER